MKRKQVPKCHGWGALALADLLASAVLTGSLGPHLPPAWTPWPGGVLELEAWAGRSAKPPSCAVGRQEKVPSAQVAFRTESEVQRALPEDGGCLSDLDKCLRAGLSPPATSLLDPK